MVSKRFNFLIVFGSLLIFVLQIVEATIVRALQHEIDLLQFGALAFTLALQSSLLGIGSGFLLLFVAACGNSGR